MQKETGPRHRAPVKRNRVVHKITALVANIAVDRSEVALFRLLCFLRTATLGLRFGVVVDLGLGLLGPTTLGLLLGLVVSVGGLRAVLGRLRVGVLILCGLFGLLSLLGGLLVVGLSRGATLLGFGRLLRALFLGL